MSFRSSSSVGGGRSWTSARTPGGCCGCVPDTPLHGDDINDLDDQSRRDGSRWDRSLTQAGRTALRSSRASTLPEQVHAVGVALCGPCRRPARAAGSTRTPAGEEVRAAHRRPAYGRRHRVALAAWLTGVHVHRSASAYVRSAARQASEGAAGRMDRILDPETGRLTEHEQRCLPVEWAGSPDNQLRCCILGEGACAACCTTRDTPSGCF